MFYAQEIRFDITVSEEIFSLNWLDIKQLNGFILLFDTWSSWRPSYPRKRLFNKPMCFCCPWHFWMLHSWISQFPVTIYMYVSLLTLCKKDVCVSAYKYIV